jgi:hypothetical protein
VPKGPRVGSWVTRIGERLKKARINGGDSVVHLWCQVRRSDKDMPKQVGPLDGVWIIERYDIVESTP